MSVGILLSMAGKITKILSRLTAARAGYLDNLAQYTTSRAAKLDRLDINVSNARTTFRYGGWATAGQVVNWTIPTGMVAGWVTIFGAGGGGAGGASNYFTNTPAYGGAGGGGGYIYWRRPYALIGGQTYEITIGAGGTGGAGAIYPGANFPIAYGSPGTAGDPCFLKNQAGAVLMQINGGTGGTCDSNGGVGGNPGFGVSCHWTPAGEFLRPHVGWEVGGGYGGSGGNRFSLADGILDKYGGHAMRNGGGVVSASNGYEYPIGSSSAYCTAGGGGGGSNGFGGNGGNQGWSTTPSGDGGNGTYIGGGGGGGGGGFRKNGGNGGAGYCGGFFIDYWI